MKLNIIKVALFLVALLVQRPANQFGAHLGTDQTQSAVDVDPIPAADATAYLQKLVDAVPVTGGTVQWTPGVYNLWGPVYIDGPQDWFRMLGDPSFVVVCNTPDAGFIFRNGGHIRNCLFDGFHAKAIATQAPGKPHEMPVLFRWQLNGPLKWFPHQFHFRNLDTRFQPFDHVFLAENTDGSAGRYAGWLELEQNNFQGVRNVLGAKGNVVFDYIDMEHVWMSQCIGQFYNPAIHQCVDRTKPNYIPPKNATESPARFSTTLINGRFDFVNAESMDNAFCIRGPPGSQQGQITFNRVHFESGPETGYGILLENQGGEVELPNQFDGSNLINRVVLRNYRRVVDRDLIEHVTPQDCVLDPEATEIVWDSPRGDYFWFVSQQTGGEPEDIYASRVHRYAAGENITVSHKSANPGDYLLVDMLLERKTKSTLPAVIRFNLEQPMFVRQVANQTGMVRVCFAKRFTHVQSETLVRLQPYGNTPRENQWKLHGLKATIRKAEGDLR